MESHGKILTKYLMKKLKIISVYTNTPLQKFIEEIYNFIEKHIKMKVDIEVKEQRK